VLEVLDSLQEVQVVLFLLPPRRVSRLLVVAVAGTLLLVQRVLRERVQLLVQVVLAALAGAVVVLEPLVELVVLVATARY
jgi:hypothetical protein